MCTAVGGRPTVEDGHIVMVEVTAPQAGSSHTAHDSVGEDEPLAPPQGGTVGRTAAKKRKERDFDQENEDEPRRRKVYASPLFTCPSLLTSEIFCRESRAAAHDCCQESDLISIIRTDLSSLLLESAANLHDMVMALYMVQFFRSSSPISKCFPWRRMGYPITATLLYNIYSVLSFDLRDGCSHHNRPL